MNYFINLIFLIFVYYFEASLGDGVTLGQCPPSQGQKCLTAITNQQLNWSDADAYCAANYPSGRLASIHNAFDGATINSGLPNLVTSPWIGAVQVGSLPFQWSDGSALDYTNWSQGQPTINHCAQVCRTSGITASGPCQQGRWATADCQNTKSQFICEYQPTTVVDCLDLKQKFPSTPSGAYLLSPPHIQPFYAFCDMTTDGGGWTVFQRRLNGDLSFYDKTWSQYKNGFNDSNDLSANLWLGNDRIHALTVKDYVVEMRVDMHYDRNPKNGNPTGQWYTKFTSFFVDDESHSYELRLFYSSGNATDGANSYSGMNADSAYTFSTIDADNTVANCTKGAANIGGWWFGSENCGHGSLNGKYYPTHYGSQEGLFWCYECYSYGIVYNPAQTSMMLRKIA